MDKEKLKKKIKQSEEILTFIAQQKGITTEQFLANVNILEKYSLEDISCALSHYCFRNGPIEDMHVEGKLSQDDMKELNKYCNDKIFTFLTMMKNNEIGKLLGIINHGIECGQKWDNAEYKED